MAQIDLIDAKTDLSGNWNIVNDVYQNKFINLLKLQKGQLKFLPNLGFSTFAWLQDGIEYGVQAFIQYLKQESAKYDIYVKNIDYDITKEGDLKLTVTISRNKDNVTFDAYLQNGVA